jgi:hypothetical protein
MLAWESAWEPAWKRAGNGTFSPAREGTPPQFWHVVFFLASAILIPPHEGAEAGAGAMLVACRLAGLSALETMRASAPACNPER